MLRAPDGSSAIGRRVLAQSSSSSSSNRDTVLGENFNGSCTWWSGSVWDGASEKHEGQHRMKAWLEIGRAKVERDAKAGHSEAACSGSDEEKSDGVNAPAAAISINRGLRLVLEAERAQGLGVGYREWIRGHRTYPFSRCFNSP